MYLEESPYQRDQLINIDQLIGRALDHGVELGDDHHKTIENYVNSGLLPRLLNGQFPATALDRLAFIDSMLKEGKSIGEIKNILDEERKKFLRKPMDLSTLVSAYKSASKSLLMLGSVGLVIFLLTTGFVNLPDSSFKKSVGQPVGKVLAGFIKEAKPANSTSTDPLGLTNVSKVITINEKQEVIIQKTITADSTTTQANNSLINTNNLTVDNIDVKNILSSDITFPNLTGAGNVCVLTLDIAQVLSCDQNLYWTAEAIKDIADTSVGSGLSELSLNGTGINVARTGNTFALSLVNEAVSSINSVKNNGGDISLVAGAGVTITANDTANTITFNLAGSGVNADLFDSIDSTQFLRSDTSDNLTSGTLTLDAGTTLSVLGTFTCTSCVGDSAIPDTITVANYLPLAGGTVAGNIDFNSNLALNLGDTGTDFTSGGGLTLAGNLTVNSKGLLSTGTLVNGAYGVDITATSNVTSAFSNTYALKVDMTTAGSAQGLIHGIYVGLTDSNGVGDTNYGLRVSLGGTDANGLQVGVTAGASNADANLVVSAKGIGFATCGDITLTGGKAAGICATGLNSSSNYGAIISGSSGATGLRAVSDTGTALQASISGASGTIVDFQNIGGSVFKIDRFGQLNMNVALAGPTCASLSNGDFGYDSSNTRIFWKWNGTCSYWNRTGTFDIAEHTPATESTEPGDILVIDTNSPTFAVKKSNSPYQQTVVGIESTDPTLVSNPDALGKTNFVSKMALAGRVPTKVSTENGPIKAGDYLTTSTTAGVAMKATTTGSVVGKALEAYNGSAVGKILVFVNVSYYLNPNEFNSYTLKDETNLAVKLGVASKYLWKNSSGAVVASVSDLGEAIFSKVTTAIANVDKLIFGEIAVKKDSQSAGVGEISAGQVEVIIPSNKVKVDSLINLTANSEPDGVLYVKTKTEGESFVVGIKRFPVNTTNQKIEFNWLIVNQE